MKVSEPKRAACGFLAVGMDETVMRRILREEVGKVLADGGARGDGSSVQGGGSRAP